MGFGEQLRANLGSAMAAAGTGLLAANELCGACVELLGVDGAAISFVHGGVSHGTYGSSGELGRHLDELQFTLGQGPCLDAVAHDRPVLVPDLAAVTEQRWPAFAGAVLDAGVRAVFAFPVSIAAVPVGAIDLFCYQPGPLRTDQLDASLHAAELAALPLLDLMGMDWTRTDDSGEPWTQLASLERVEVYQATGMIMAQLGVGPAEALIRLRGHAFAHDQTASEVAWAIVRRALSFEADQDGEGSS
jgi:hypothetical protein